MRDVEQGYVSRRGALSDYGVVITGTDGRIHGARPGPRPAHDGEARIEGPTTAEGRRVVRVRVTKDGAVVDDRLEIHPSARSP